MGHRLLELLTDAASGRFPPVDGGVTMCPPLADGREAVVSFSGHAVIASGLGAEDLADLRPDGFGRALDPRLLVRLAGDGTIGTIDITMVTFGTGGGSLPPAVVRGIELGGRRSAVTVDHRRERRRVGGCGSSALPHPTASHPAAVARWHVADPA
jgi:hypothetical protein